LQNHILLDFLFINYFTVKFCSGWKLTSALGGRKEEGYVAMLQVNAK